MAQEKLVVLDTNILIEIIRENVTVIKKCDQLGTVNLAISSVSFNEFLLGSRDKQDLAKNLKFVKKFHFYRVNQSIDKIFTGLIETYCLSYRPGIPDMIIAATALFYNIPLYTLNKKDFRFIPELRLIE